MSAPSIGQNSVINNATQGLIEAFDRMDVERDRLEVVGEGADAHLQVVSQVWIDRLITILTFGFVKSGRNYNLGQNLDQVVTQIKTTLNNNGLVNSLVHPDLVYTFEDLERVEAFKIKLDRFNQRLNSNAPKCNQNYLRSLVETLGEYIDQRRGGVGVPAPVLASQIPVAKAPRQLSPEEQQAQAEAERVAEEQAVNVLHQKVITRITKTGIKIGELTRKQLKNHVKSVFENVVQHEKNPARKTEILRRLTEAAAEGRQVIEQERVEAERIREAAELQAREDAHKEAKAQIKDEMLTIVQNFQVFRKKFSSEGTNEEVLVRFTTLLGTTEAFLKDHEKEIMTHLTPKEKSRFVSQIKALINPIPDMAYGVNSRTGLPRTTGPIRGKLLTTLNELS